MDKVDENSTFDTRTLKRNLAAGRSQANLVRLVPEHGRQVVERVDVNVCVRDNAHGTRPSTPNAA